jgi:hypothetical protein
MLPTKRILAALSAAAVIGFAADAAQAQEYGRGGSDGGATRGTGKVQFQIGAEGWLDSRGVIYSDAEFEQIGATNTLDEHALEHDAEHVYQHSGLFVTLGGRMDLSTPVSFGVRLGSFTANNRNNSQNPGAAREVQDIVTRPGFAGGIFADIRVPMSSGMWISGTFDFYYGQAAIDNFDNTFGGFVWQGEYQFMNVELSGRFGFDVNNSGVSPFIGFEAAFFQVVFDVEDPQATGIGAVEGINATAESWSPFRIIFGVEFSPTNSNAISRLQIAIWNPGRDFGGAVEISLPIG